MRARLAQDNWHQYGMLATSRSTTKGGFWGDLDRGTPIVVVTDAGAVAASFATGSTITRR